MLCTNRNYSKKLIRGAVLFTAIALLLQCIAVFFMTPTGVAGLFPYILLARSETVNTADASLGEYFPLHKDAEEAGLIVLSVDTNVAASYRLASDYLEFLGKFTDISAVALYTQNMKVSAMSSAAEAGDYEKFSAVCDNERKLGVLPNQLIDLAGKVYTLNSRLSPDKKLKMCGIKGSMSLSDLINSLSADLIMVPGGFSGEHTEVMDARTEAEYAALFEKHGERLRELLGNSYDYHAQRSVFAAAGTLEASTAALNLEKYAPAGEGAVFALMPEYLCKEDSPFLEAAREIYGSVLVTRVFYSDCESFEDGKPVLRDSSGIPKIFDGIRIAAADRLDGFGKYRAMTGGDGSIGKDDVAREMISAAGKETFFIIGGSEAVDFGAEEEAEKTGTVTASPA